MATASVLPDTCAWIDFFRGRQTPLATAVEQALLNGSVVTCGVVLYELLQGIKGAREEKALLDAFQAVPVLELTTGLWIEAGRLAARLRSKGTNLPLSDVVIATLATNHHATVLTVDQHFSAVPALRVSAGT